MKKFLKKSWFISIACTIVGTVISTFIIDWIRNVSLANTITSVLVWIWNGILCFLNFDIKVWWLLIAIGFLVFILWIIVKCTEVKEEPPSFLKYTQDFFSGQCWRWSWRKNWEGKYEITNLHPICNKCKTPLVPKYDYDNNLMCPRCKAVTHSCSDNKRSILVLINDNVIKNIYRKEDN